MRGGGWSLTAVGEGLIRTRIGGGDDDVIVRVPRTCHEASGRASHIATPWRALL